MSNELFCSRASYRAKKAQLALFLDGKLIRVILGTLLTVLIGLWVWQGLIELNSLAHFIAIGIALLSIVLFWYYGELRNLDVCDNTELRDVSGRLERQLLARLKSNHNVDDVVAVAFNLGGGIFFTTRFMVLASDVSRELKKGTEISVPQLWDKAVQLSDAHGQKEISAAAVIAAAILVMPSSDEYLATLQLDADDINAGIGWYVHMQHTIEHHLSRKDVGGIGRDLSFGWASLLNRIGHNISDSLQRYGSARRTPQSRNITVDQLMHVLSQPGRRNAALVGDVGVGKTTIVHALAAQLLEEASTVPEVLKFRQVIELDAAHIVSNAKGPGHIEQLMIKLFNEALRVKNVIIFFDNAELFFKDGTGSVDISSIMLPVLQGGSLQVIFSLTDQQWQHINQLNPEMAQLLNRVIVKPLDEDETTQVMQDEALLLEAKHGIVYTYRSLQTAYRLSQRYIRDQSFPGRAIKLLEASTGFAEGKHFITDGSVSEAVERTYGVKVQAVNTLQEKDKLLNLESQIHERMVNQSRAVKLVSDALRRARTGVRNENKPIGTFMFLGPTGVGKTELSKSLADVYFGGEDRLIRVDMNEYSRSDDTSRLLAGASTDPHSLSAQITKQPFSVVLLDEIEKAHPNVVNILLQMLDEGMLRDNDNKPVSFRDAIIITTSNAGADKIRLHIDKGKTLEDFEEQFVNELIDANLFKPEFLNRFDEIVLFRPLNPDELLQVVDLLLADLNNRLAVQKVSIDLTMEAKQLLVDTGYDPRLGARPLRRTVQRAVENLVAERMLSNEIKPGQTLSVNADELAKILNDRK